jgi:hypothetical protein
MVLGVFEWRPNVYGTTVRDTLMPATVADSSSLATAEMKCLVSSVYRKYSTDLCPEMESYAPGVTIRFEVFYDDTVGKVKVRNLLAR